MNTEPQLPKEAYAMASRIQSEIANLRASESKLKAEVERLTSLSDNYRTALARIVAQKALPQPMAFNTAIIIAELELEHEH